VSNNSQIHKSAQVSEKGVEIGANCIIEEFVSIKPGTIIGDNCIIQAGSRLGDSGFEFKRTSDGILAVNHDAGLIIGNNVQVGANSTVGRGFLGKDTSIGDDTKIDFGVSIAHRSSIGKRVFIAAGVVVSGSTQIGSDTWIGPSAVISNGLTIGERSHIALGSVVVKSFPENSWLMGVPARNVPKS
jgi:UDP-3-O-[3-hydroxymyristoyl] glucosamine N-acyltransferase